MGKVSRAATHEKEFQRLKGLTQGLAISMLKPDQIAHQDWLAEKLYEEFKAIPNNPFLTNAIPGVFFDKYESLHLDVKKVFLQEAQFLMNHFIIVPTGKPVQDPTEIMAEDPAQDTINSEASQAESKPTSPGPGAANPAE